MSTEAKRDDGGQAFPQFDYGNRGCGMTMRDYFAASNANALAQVVYIQTGVALNRAAKAVGFDGTVAQYVAREAYQLADALLAERAK